MDIVRFKRAIRQHRKQGLLFKRKTQFCGYLPVKGRWRKGHPWGWHRDENDRYSLLPRQSDHRPQITISLLPVQTSEQVVATMAKDQKGRFLSIQHFR
jgi:hypothetical protein